MEENKETEGTIKSFSSPRLSPEEKLYVRVYLHTLSHSKAYEAVRPGLSNYSDYRLDNIYSRREAIKFYIAQGLQEKAEALTLTPDVVLQRLYKEAVREGSGSNHAARIQALTLLGKHLGLFEEKKDTNQFTFNIVNYSGEQFNDLPSPEESKKIEDESNMSDETVRLEDIEDKSIDDNIDYINYSSPQQIDIKDYYNEQLEV